MSSNLRTDDGESVDGNKCRFKACSVLKNLETIFRLEKLVHIGPSFISQKDVKRNTLNTNKNTPDRLD